MKTLPKVGDKIFMKRSIADLLESMSGQKITDLEGKVTGYKQGKYTIAMSFGVGVYNTEEVMGTFEDKPETKPTMPISVDHKYRLKPRSHILCDSQDTFEIESIGEKVINLLVRYSIPTREFEKNFKLVSTPRGWTEWKAHEDMYMYRTDNKKFVQVRKAGKTATAKCHPCDTFDLRTGLVIAFKKLVFDLTEEESFIPRGCRQMIPPLISEEKPMRKTRMLTTEEINTKLLSGALPSRVALEVIGRARSIMLASCEVPEITFPLCIVYGKSNISENLEPCQCCPLSNKDECIWCQLYREAKQFNAVKCHENRVDILGTFSVIQEKLSFALQYERAVPETVRKMIENFKSG